MSMTDHQPTLDNGKLHAASDDLALLRRDIEKLSRDVTALVKNQTAAASANLMQAIDAAKGSIADSATEAGERVSSLGTELEATIARNPITSLLIALGVGVMAGMMTHSRR